MKNSIPLLLILTLALPLSVAKAEEDDSFSLLLGGGLTDNTLKVRTGDEINSQMVGDRALTYFVGFTKVPTPIFGDGWLSFLRWSIEGEFTQFKTAKTVANRVSDVQGTDSHNLGNEVDFGNSIKGETAYLTPTISLFLGSSTGLYVHLGFGAGAGWAHLKGDYFVTDGTSASASCLSASTYSSHLSSCQRETLNVSKAVFGSNALLGFGYGNLGFKYFRGGPTFKMNGRTIEASRQLGVMFYQFRF